MLTRHDVQDQLKREGRIRSFKVQLKTSEFALLFLEDYVSQIREEQRKRPEKEQAIFSACT